MTQTFAAQLIAHFNDTSESVSENLKGSSPFYGWVFKGCFYVLRECKVDKGGG
jgi:hypothetical protein